MRLWLCLKGNAEVASGYYLGDSGTVLGLLLFSDVAATLFAAGFGCDGSDVAADSFPL